jgi:ABC-type glycerol-3-phosphate transport system substrate-binding protein
MNTKILMALLFIALIVTASGCVQDAADPGTTDPTDQASENQIIDELNEEIIDEDEDIDLGELV